VHTLCVDIDILLSSSFLLSFFSYLNSVLLSINSRQSIGLEIKSSRKTHPHISHASPTHTAAPTHTTHTAYASHSITHLHNHSTTQKRIEKMGGEIMGVKKKN